MSVLVLIVFVLLGIGGQPSSKASPAAWIAWALVMLALLGAILVDAKGWP